MSQYDPREGPPHFNGPTIDENGHPYEMPQPPPLYTGPRQPDLFDRALKVAGQLAALPVAITAVFLIGHAIMPASLDPAKGLGSAIGAVDSAAINGHAEASGRLARKDAEGRLIPQARAESLKAANAGNETLANLGTFGCALAGIVPSQGDYASLHQLFQAGCGIAEDATRNAMRTYDRYGRSQPDD